VTSPPSTPVVSLSGDTLRSTPALQYQWYLNNIPLSSANAQEFVALLSGNYSVRITDASGCTATSPQIYVSILGLEKPENIFYFTCFPNPSDNILTVVFQSARSGKIKTAFYDVLGCRIFSEELQLISNEQTFNFNLREFSPGVYFIQIEFGGYKWIRSIIRQ
jgi:hypothetical protein